MKILYGIQGTGNGHISRALELIPHLRQHYDVDILVSGTQAEVKLPWRIKYQFHGLGFTFGDRGGVDIRATWKSLRVWQLLKDIAGLNLDEYDLIISDYEPVSAWAAKMRGVPCLGLSHQASFLSKNSPKADKKPFWMDVLFHHYAPATLSLGFHFKSYDYFIFPPIIRKSIRNAAPKDKGHISVYLPAYSENTMLSIFRQIPDFEWQVFVKNRKEEERIDNIRLLPVDSETFTQSLIDCHGILCGGGFETPAEAMFLGKKVFVVPMHNQYEQRCNALAAKKLGCTVAYSLDDHFEYKLRSWLDYGKAVVHQPEDPISMVIRFVSFFRPEHYQEPFGRLNPGWQA